MNIKLPKPTKVEPSTPAAQSGPPRTRSPNYPSLNLATAVERAKVLWEYSSTHWTPVGIAQAKWGFKANSSAASQCVAAVKAFGLIDTQGVGESKEIRPSAEAKRILLGTPDRDDLLRAAALKPSLHAELWKKYGRDGLPPNEIIKQHLLLDRNFNKDAVDDFIKQFRETAGLAKLSQGDIIESGQDGLDDENESDGADNIEFKMPEIKATQPNANRIVRDLTFPLIGGDAAILRVPLPLSEANFGLLTTLLNAMKTAIVSAPEEKTGDE